jgi:hypothetical protein
MMTTLASLVLCGALAQGSPKSHDAGYLCASAYAIDNEVRGPIKPYVPQAGDIYMSTDRSRIIQAGHRMALSGQPNHSGLVILLEGGKPAILEAGPFNGLKVEIVDLYGDLKKHEERTETTWIRQRKTPLSKEQSDELTRWAHAQNGKRFAAGRMMAQLTPFRSRGPLRTYVMGTPNGERDSYFCAELVMESCVHVGILSKETTRPSCTYPQDMFFDKSYNLYLNNNFTLADGWHPPARWVSQGPPLARFGAPQVVEYRTNR